MEIRIGETQKPNILPFSLKCIILSWYIGRVSVSRAVKPLVDDVRPGDYFSQKNCALQYSAMLDKAGTPKRKRTSEGAPEVGEIVN